MSLWLMKTEPDEFSFEDLVRAPQRTHCWDGVRNYQARNFMRDEFAINDEVFVYHSSTAEPAVAGIAKVVRAAYPDPTALQPKSEYFDPKSKAAGTSRWVMVDVKAVARFGVPVTLKVIRAQKGLATMALVRPGQRFSIQPVSAAEWRLIVGLGKPIAL